MMKLLKIQYTIVLQNKIKTKQQELLKKELAKLIGDDKELENEESC